MRWIPIYILVLSSWQVNAQVSDCASAEKCGCWNGYCWSRAETNGTFGTSWSFTQRANSTGGGRDWACCLKNDDCSLTLPRGFGVYTGPGQKTPEGGSTCAAVTGLPAPAENSTAISLNATADPFDCSTGVKCGCWNGYCWSRVEANGTLGGRWSFTQRANTNASGSDWACCQQDSDCIFSFPRGAGIYKGDGQRTPEGGSTCAPVIGLQVSNANISDPMANAGPSKRGIWDWFTKTAEMIHNG